MRKLELGLAAAAPAAYEGPKNDAHIPVKPSGAVQLDVVAVAAAAAAPTT